MHLIRLFCLTAEGTLVHEGDLLCKEKKSIPLPEESFDLVGTLATEKKQGARNQERQMVE